MTAPRTPYHDPSQTPLSPESAACALREMEGDFEKLVTPGNHATFACMANTLRECWDTLCDTWAIEDAPASGWLHIVVKLRKQGKLNDREYLVGLVDGWLQQAESLLVASDEKFLKAHEDIHSSIWKCLKSSHGKLLASLSGIEKNKSA
ncbi:MAG: hypothetical protein RLN60_00095 [Phycisphaerales bacterium]